MVRASVARSVRRAVPGRQESTRNAAACAAESAHAPKRPEPPGPASASDDSGRRFDADVMGNDLYLARALIASPISLTPMIRHSTDMIVALLWAIQSLRRASSA